MSEIDSLILSLINENANLEKIKEETKLYNSQLLIHLRSLKNKGYNIEKELCVNGLRFKLNKTISENNSINLITNNKCFKFIVISDTHICSINEQLEKIEQLYDYAIKRKINHIFHAGDIIEGVYRETINNSDVTKIDNVIKQIEYLIKYYPKRTEIITSYILGNHDIHSIRIEGIDISKIIENKRLDMYMLGYIQSDININNRKIVISHPSYPDNYSIEKCKYNNPDLIFNGHYHNSKIWREKNTIIANVPPLFMKFDQIGAFEIAMESNNNDLDLNNIIIKPLVLEREIYPITDIVFELPKKDCKQLTKNLSQIDKFNIKYN